MNIPINNIKTPAYLVDENLLIKNLEVLKSVMDKTAAKILLAQKGFSMFYFYPLIGEYLSGTTSSGIFEAMLSHKYMKKENHVYSPAFSEHEIKQINDIATHVVFNSFNQLNSFGPMLNKNISVGLRVNPEYAEVETEIYNPCGKFSRLGILQDDILKNNINNIYNIDGIHFHTMCEQNSDVLVRTFEVVESKFKNILKQIKWINLGGGHHITRPDYDISSLIDVINHIKKTYDIEVYLEPGEAIALNTGYLISSVLDIVNNKMDIAILDTSACCHMPDVIEMPYRPNIIGASLLDKHNYRLAGPTCLAGDIIGDYSFKQKLNIGDKLIFCDMAHYTMVKNNTFNGMPLPSIYVYTKDNNLKLIKQFGFDDFEQRLS